LHHPRNQDLTASQPATNQPTARQPGGQPERAGLWLDVQELLELPLDADAKAQLWRLALRQHPNAPPEQQVPLQVALARHCGQASAGAAAEGHWGLMQQELAEAMAAYSRLAELSPDRAAAARQELGHLIGKLTADLHASVHAHEPPPPIERGALCWHGFQLGQAYRRLQLEQPDWLWHLDEQLVREGAIALRQLASDSHNSETATVAEQPDAAQRQLWRRKALELLLHLSRLHQPCPDWIGQAAQELLVLELEATLGSGAAVVQPQELQQLLSWAARLPLPPEQAAAVQLAAQRGICSLQLLLHSSKPRPRVPPAAPPPPAAQAATPQDPRELHRALQLGVEAWLADHPAKLRTHRLEPVLRPGQAPVLQDGQRLQLNVGPLLAFPQVELLDQLLPAFFTPLQQAARGGDLQLAEPNSTLWRELVQLWQAGGQLNHEQFQGLVYFTALWNRCGGPGALDADCLGWELPVAPLQPGQSLLRPGNVELAALQTVLLQRNALEELLAEIRRHHHDRSWMESQRDNWWYDPSDGSENLRRLHTNAGFYASSNAPLESLQRWSQATVRALLAGPVLFGNASITQMWWPVAQQLARQSGQLPSLVQWPGEQAFYAFIAGQEVLFVTPLASDVEAHHRSGKAFALFDDLCIEPYGLRCIEAPMSVYPNRPERGFEDSLERTLEQIDRAYRQKPFAVFTAACGAYGLPLCEAVKTRYGVSCLYIGNLMHAHFGVLQNTSRHWRVEHRIAENWVTSQVINSVPGVDRIEDGRYLG
jgi:hypothetical protein